MTFVPNRPPIGSVERDGKKWVPILPTKERGLSRPLGEAMDYLVQAFKNREIRRLTDEIYRMLKVEPTGRPWTHRTVYIIDGSIQEDLKKVLREHPLGAHDLQHPEDRHWVQALIQAASSNPRFMIVDGAGLDMDEIDNMLRACRGWRGDFPGSLCIFLPHYPWGVQNFEQESFGRLLRLEF